MSTKFIAFLGMSTVLLAAGTPSFAADAQVTKAVAVLHPTEGNKAHGRVSFNLEENDAIGVTARVENLSSGKHGFHIHEYGNCSAPDATSAGGHFNPEGHEHGAPGDEKRHVGDLGNLEPDEHGIAVYTRQDDRLALEGDHSIIGRAVVVHEKVDDLTSQPTGAAGARIACGVIGIEALGDKPPKK